MQDTEDSMPIGFEERRLARWRRVSLGWCWLPDPSPASTLGVVRSARFTWSQCTGMLMETSDGGEVDRPCRP